MSDFTVEAPDGKVIAFPADTPRAEIERVMENYVKGMMKPQPMTDADRMAGTASKAADSGLNIVNQLRTGLAEGTKGMLSFPSFMADMAQKGGRNLYATARWALGAKDPGDVERFTPPNRLPDYQDVSKVVDPVATLGGRVPYAEQPQGLLEQGVRNVGRVAPGLPNAAALPVTLGTAAGMTGGQVLDQGPLKGTKYEGYAEPVLSVAGGLLGAAPSMVRSTPAEMVARRTEGMTPQDWQKAQAIQERSVQQGIPLTASEAMDNPAMGRLFADTRASAGGGEGIERFLSQRPQQVRSATASMLDDIAAAKLPEDVARRVQQAATDVISGAEKARTRASSPFYKMAENEPLHPDSIKRITDEIDRIAQTTSPSVTKGLMELKADILAKPTIGPVSQTVKLQRDAADMPAFGADLKAKATGSSAGPVVRLAEQEMETGSLPYLYGQSTYRNMSPRVEELTQGNIGRLAKPRPEDMANVDSTLGGQTRVILNPDTARPETIRKIAFELSSKDPTAFRDWSRTYLENAYNDATQKLVQGKPDVAGGYKFANSVMGDPGSQKAANLRAVIEESARANGQNPSGVWRGWQNFMDTLDRTGSMPGIGSQTGGRAEAFNEARQGLMTNALDVSLSKPMSVIQRWRADAFQRQNFAELADLLTRPDGVAALQKLAMERPGSARAYALTAALLSSNAKENFGK